MKSKRILNPGKQHFPLVLNRSFSPLKANLGHSNLKSSRSPVISPFDDKTFDSIEFSSPERLNDTERTEVLTLRSQSSIKSPFLYKVPSLPSVSQNRRSDIIKKNIKKCLLTPENVIKDIEKKKRKKLLMETINKETKKVLFLRKLERIEQRLNRKFNKSHYEKVQKEKIAFSKGLISLLTAFSYAKFISLRFYQMRSYRKKIHSYIIKISAISKALGKFLRLLKRAKLVTAKKKIKIIMPQYIKRFKIWLISKHTKTIMSVVDNFMKFGSIARVNFIINFHIKLIQRAIRDFLCINRHRKFVLKLLWNKLDFNKHKALEYVQHYYIGAYLKRELKNFVADKSKAKNFTSFITSAIFQRDFEFYPLENYQVPVFRVFKRNNIKKVIKTAYLEKREWNTAKFVRQPYEYLNKDEAGINLNSIMKKGKKSTGRKVTFRILNQ